MDEPGIVRARELESDVNVERTVVGVVKARDVHLSGSAAGVVGARGNLSIVNGGCGPVLANGDVTIRYGGCGPMIANGDVTIEYGGTQGVLAAGGATIGPKAFVGIVLSPKVTVSEGAKVVLSSRQALAFGAAAGAVFALVSRLVKR